MIVKPNNIALVSRYLAIVAAALVFCSTIAIRAAEPKKIVIIAGKKSHGPVGNGIHDYPWSARLLKVMLENSNIKDQVRVETHFDGWPTDDATLDDADAIMVISDGRDGDKYEEAPHFQTPEKTACIAKQIERGCGFLTFHFSTFAPDANAEQILDWSGGYFDWETDGRREWYSAIQTTEAEVQLASPEHPIARGLKPFRMQEEFYFNIRFAEGEGAATPLWVVPALPGREPDGRVVAWARERQDGGRGFGTTAGHFYSNWEHDHFRKLILNAIAWSAQLEVPAGGVEAKYYTHDEILAALENGKEEDAEDAINVVIVTGHQYPGHKWEETTPALIEALEVDKRIQIKVVNDIEFLAAPQLHDYDAMVLNYCNWERPEGLSDEAKANFVKYLQQGGGLTIVHFANGAFHFSLPKAGESDWPEFRNICRRVWDHTEGKSGHDRYGKFRVDIANQEHAITRGMQPFETIDELYFKQQGDAPIEVVATARSTITGNDEPMAFVYNYGQGRVFQTVLGHAAESIRVPGAAELIRRGTIWAANKPQQGDSSAPKKEDGAAQAPPQREKITGHWGEDAIGFRWTEEDSVDGRWSQTQVGRHLASALWLPRGAAEKALTLRLGDEQKASVCYDTGLLNLRAGWTGGFLRFDPARFGLIKAPEPDGEIQLFMSDGPGWLGGKVQYGGMFRHGSRAMLSYSVGETPVLESPWYEASGDVGLFTRTLEVGPRAAPLSMVVCDLPGDAAVQTVDGVRLAFVNHEGQATAVAVASDGNSASIQIVDGTKLVLSLPAGNELLRCKVLIGKIDPAQLSQFAAAVHASSAPLDLQTFMQPGPPQWPAEIVTRGRLGAPAGAFAVDTLTLPFDNPYKALMFVGGHDFFSGGDAAICTIHGDVWLVSGIDDKLEKLTWRRFATGLFQPLGLRIVDDMIYVLGRDQITRLHDSNGDGATDFYECFNNDGASSAHGHDYAACLETDSAGNFYYVRAKEGLVRVSADGMQHESIADGFRNPNGMSIGPGDVITVAPQEGEWTPASNIVEIKPGGYYGFGGPRAAPDRPLGYDPPLCWIPRLIDNSSGGQVWVTSESWQPLFGQMMHLCYGRCWPLLVLREEVDGVAQGGVIQLPINFESGVMRGRFNPNDGQLYVSGLKGWASAASRDGCLQRVRYVGGAVHLPVAVKTFANGLAITFAEPLDRAMAEDVGNYSLQKWNYRWRAEYGSPDYSVANPRREGRDDVDVISATLLDDSRTVFLEIEALRPVMQFAISYRLADAAAAPLENTLYYTINKVGEQRLTPARSRPRNERPGRLPRELEANLANGLIMRFTQDDGGQRRTDARPARMAALYVEPNQPPTPFLGGAPFHATAEGYLKVKLRGDYQFSFQGAGKAELLVNGESVLKAAGDDLSHTISPVVSLVKGYNKIAIRYTPWPEQPAALRLCWSCDEFANEPVQPDSLFYNQQDPQLLQGDALRVGRQLFAERHCASCHGPAQPRGVADSAMPELAASPPNLAASGDRFTTEWLYRWLLDPAAMRNHVSMPRLFDEQVEADRRQAADIAAYLSKLQVAKPSGSIDDLDTDNLAQHGELLFEDLGCISCHRLTAPDVKDEFERTSLHYVSAKYRSGALAAFLLAPHQHYSHSRMPDFRLSGEEGAALAAYLRAKTKDVVLEGDSAAAGDPARGRELFAHVGCQACHAIGDQTATPPNRVFPATNGARRGCLAAGEERGNAPDFGFSDKERAALEEFLLRGSESIAQAAPAEASQRLVARLRCGVCHDRDGAPSLWPEVLFEEGVQGHAPELVPHLTWTGEKLHGDWTREFLAGRVKYRPRPWMKARMPVFPAYADILARGFAAEHGLAANINETAESTSSVADSNTREVGRLLMSKDGGFNCVQCHAMTDDVLKLENKSQGVGLSYIKERIRGDYYDRWMRDPLRIDPGSKMPKFAPDGQTTTLKDVYDGDAGRQFEAVWAYLQSIERSQHTNRESSE